MLTGTPANFLRAFCAYASAALFSLSLSGQTYTQSSSPVQALGTLSDLTSSATNPQNQTGTAAPMIVPEDFSKLRVAAGFLLHLQTFEAPDLSGLFRVDDSGNILVPLAGSLHVADLSTTEVGQLLEKRFVESNILKHPQISVSIEQYPSYLVTVLGEVKFPGRFGLIAPHSLLDVLSIGGGETPIAGDRVQIRHPDGTLNEYIYKKNSNGQSVQNVSISAGDTVIVPRAGIVYVLGSVIRPGGYIMQEDGDLDVAQALSMALGLTLQAKVSNVRIVRKRPDGSYETIPVDYQKFTSGKEAPVKLMAEDIVYVPVSKVKSVFTTGAGLIGAAATSTVYAFRP